MKASEIKNIVKKIIKEHGDIDVVLIDKQGGYHYCFNLKNVEIVTNFPPEAYETRVNVTIDF